MGKFTYTDPQGVTLFQRSLNTIRATKRAEQSPALPPTTSASDLAWSAVYRLAQEMVRAREAADVRAAVDLLREVNHPVYERYLAASASDRPPASTTGDVVKRATVNPPLVTRNQVMDTINKRADRLVATGAALTHEGALRQIFKDDRALYDQYRHSSYAQGPLAPTPSREGAAVVLLPTYAVAKALALEMRSTDPWGAHVGKSEDELVQAVFDAHPALFEAYRREATAR